MKKLSRTLFGGTLVLCLTAHAPSRAEEPGYRPSLRADDGVELGFVYFGSMGCGFCRDPRLKQAVKKAKDLLYERAVREKRPFAATGVATDWTLESGERFLADVGPFDQVIIGKGEFNLGVLTFVAHDAGAMPGYPQVVVYEQEVRRTPTRVLAGRPRILARHAGNDIIQWVADGVPLGEE